MHIETRGIQACRLTGRHHGLLGYIAVVNMRAMDGKCFCNAKHLAGINEAGVQFTNAFEAQLEEVLLEIVEANAGNQAETCLVEAVSFFRGTPSSRNRTASSMASRRASVSLSETAQSPLMSGEVTQCSPLDRTRCSNRGSLLTGSIPKRAGLIPSAA